MAAELPYLFSNMERRSFLSSSAKAVLALAAAPLLRYEQAFGVPANTREWGIQLYTLRSVISDELKTVIKELSKMGYKKVEGFTDNKGHYFGLPTKRLKYLLDENGMTMVSEHVPLGLEDYYATESSPASLKYRLDSLIQSAKDLGQTYLVIPSLPTKVARDPNQWPIVVETIKQAAQMTMNEGVKIAYHNHEFEFIDYGGICLLQYLINNTDYQELCFEMDAYWVTRAGQSPEKWLGNNPKRFELMHVKDMVSKEDSTMVPVGKGSIPYKSIIPFAEKLNVQHFFYEQDTIAGDWKIAAQGSIDYLKNQVK